MLRGKIQLSIARVSSTNGPPYAETVSHTPTKRMRGFRLCRFR